MEEVISGSFTRTSIAKCHKARRTKSQKQDRLEIDSIVQGFESTGQDVSSGELSSRILGSCSVLNNLIWNVSLHKVRQKSQRFLPSEVTSLGGNHIGYPFLDDGQISPD